MSDLQTVLLIATVITLAVFTAGTLTALGMVFRHLVRLQEQLLIATAVHDDAAARQHFITGMSYAGKAPEIPGPDLSVPDELADKSTGKGMPFPPDGGLLAPMLGSGPVLGAPAGGS